jgi:hypothetical protein
METRENRVDQSSSFISWAAYARAHGLDVIPEVKLLTHQEQFFQKHHPGLMFNAVSYDPRKEGVYQVVFRLLDELIDALHPRAIHIGPRRSIWMDGGPGGRNG